jgi:AraC-like DNA-binding protein
MGKTPPSPFLRPFDRDLLRHLDDPRVPFELFDHVPGVYLFIKDREHRFVKVNRGTLQLHACETEDEMLGFTDFDFHPPAFASQYTEEDRRVMESRRTLSDQVWLVTGADGMPHWYLSTKIPLIGIAGDVIGIAGVMRPFNHTGEAPGEYRRLTPALEFVLEHFGDRVTVDDIAKRAHLSVSHLQREFQRIFGMTPSDYLLRVRLLMARRRLEQTNEPIGKLALDCGFYDQSHFTRAFRRATGLRPLDYRRRFSPKPRATA